MFVYQRVRTMRHSSVYVCAGPSEPGIAGVNPSEETLVAGNL